MFNLHEKVSVLWEANFLEDMALFECAEDEW